MFGLVAAMVVRTVPGTGLEHAEFRKLPGLQQIQVVLNGPFNGTKGLYAGLSQFSECSPTDATDHNGVHSPAIQGSERLALSVGMVKIRFSNGLKIATVAVDNDEIGRRAEMAEYRAVQSHVGFRGKRNFHFNPPLLSSQSTFLSNHFSGHGC